MTRVFTQHQRGEDIKPQHRMLVERQNQNQRVLMLPREQQQREIKALIGVQKLFWKIVEFITCMSSCWSFTSLSQNIAYLNSSPFLLLSSKEGWTKRDTQTHEHKENLWICSYSSPNKFNCRTRGVSYFTSKSTLSIYVHWRLQVRRMLNQKLASKWVVMLHILLKHASSNLFFFFPGATGKM